MQNTNLILVVIKSLKFLIQKWILKKMNLMTLFIIKIIELVGSDVVITDGISK